MYAIRFTVEKDKAIETPLYATGVRRRNYGSYVGIDKQFTDRVEDASTYAKATTAAKWAKEMTATDMAGYAVLYGYEVVEVQA